MTDTLVGTLVPIAFFLFLAAIILTKPVLRSRERQALLKVAQVALEKGQPWPPELLDSLKFQDTPPTAVADLRKGAVLLAVAAAMALLFVTLPAYELLGAAAFPALLGLVYIGFGIAGRKTPKA